MANSNIKEELLKAELDKKAFYQENKAVLVQWEELLNKPQAMIEKALRDLKSLNSIVGLDEYKEPVELSFKRPTPYIIEHLTFNLEEDLFEMTYRGKWTEADLKFVTFTEEDLYKDLTP